MTLAGLLRLTDRNPIAFDLALGSAAIARAAHAVAERLAMAAGFASMARRGGS